MLACDTETGEVRLIQSVKGVVGTSYLQLDSGEWSLYSFSGEKRGERTVGSLVRFPLDIRGRLGAMETLTDLPCETPCHLTLSPDGRKLAFAAYTSATVGLADLTGGDLKARVLPDDRMGDNVRRQEKSHAHYVFFIPGQNSRLGVVDLGCDRIRFFDTETLKPIPSLEINFPPGEGPRHAIWSKNGKFLFVVTELKSNVYSFAFDGRSFRKVGQWALLPKDRATDESYASAIKLTQDGKLLLASNRGYDSIAFFDVNAETGVLSLRTIAPLKGSYPRDFELLPGEKFMVVGHERSDEVQIYAFDRAACTLAPVGQPIKMWRPVCFKFADPSLASLKTEVLKDSLTPVRPGGVNGQEFWNAHANWFMYPPSFQFADVPGAKRYRFTALDDQHRRQVFESAAPTDPLTPIWEALPCGFVSVRCEGLDGNGRVIGLAGERNRFWKQAPFSPGKYPVAKRDYVSAARLVYDYLFERPSTRYLLQHTVPDPSYSRNAYPTKMGAALISGMVKYAKMCPERAEEAMKIARLQADYLISVSQPAGAPLEYFPPTYAGDKLTAKDYLGENMLLYPAAGAQAYLSLFAATGETKYRQAAVRIAETYLKLQGADGTWPLKVLEKTGRPLARNRCFPMTMMELFMRLFKLTGETKWRDASDRAFAFIEKGPLADWNWEGQFEDVKPTEKFVNLTKHPACSTAMYLLSRYPGDARRLAQARELLRFAEDQFICWERPSRPDGIGPRWENAPGKFKWVQTDYLDWALPGVLEQYHCYHPIDASAAKLINTYLALYKTSGNRLDLEKARVLADAVVNVQDDDGRIPTHWNIKQFWDRDYDWVNCMFSAAAALENLSAVVDGRQ